MGDEAAEVALGPDERRRRVEAGQLDVLERIARGDPLPHVLEAIALLIESVTDEGVATILRVDRETGTVHHGAAPSLPEAFIAAIDGSRIGPEEGSCGAAAYLKQRVVVDDIATHRNWRHYKDVALPMGLRACWSSPILDRHGEILGTFAIYYPDVRTPNPTELACVDIATHLAAIAIEKEAAEERLRESELRYRRVYDNVVDVVFHVERNAAGRFRFTAVNASFGRATGLDASQVVGKWVDEIIPPESIGMVLDAYRRAIDERTTVSWDEVSEYPLGTKHGQVTVTAIFDSSDRFLHLVGTVHDITPYKLAQARIAAQAQLLDRAHDSIVLLGVDDDVRFWNRGATRLYGHREEDAIGRRFSDLVPSDPAVRSTLRDRLLRDGEFSAELRRRSTDGRERIVESSATLLRDEQGRPTEILVIETDITERKAIEAQFLRAQRVESLGTLAGGVAHDFNNILTGILAHVRSASRALPPDHAALRSLTEIERASWRAAELTRRILTFSRRVDSTRVHLDVRGPVHEAFELLQATVPPPVEIESEIEADVPDVVGDATAIHQVVMNLGTNAAHAIGNKNGRVAISLRGVRVTEARPMLVGSVAPGRYAVLEVTDSGSGIDRTTLERIFEPYFTTKSNEGTGLGLSVVHGIVLSHDGAIEVESEVGRGTTFRVYLPSVENPHRNENVSAGRAASN